MSKLKLTGLALPLFLLFASPQASAPKAFGGTKKVAQSQGGTLQKMIVENGSVIMDLDLNRLNGLGSAPQKTVTLQFAVAANSFFSILVFNDLLRGPEQGSMTLIPQTSSAAGVNAPGYSLPVSLGASIRQLAVEKLSSDAAFDLAVRDEKTGFVFFNVEGDQYGYDANAQLLSITGGRLLVSNEFAKALGRPSDAGSVAGEISIGATMEPIEINHLDENGNVKSASLPALNQPLPGTVPGPDVIVGNLLDFVQSQTGSVGGRVGLALGTDACNKGTVNVDWFALPSNDHPFIPQNVYRMSGGATNNERFEQIGQSWGKHAFAAASSNSCGFGCNGVGGDHLGSGCSDAYGAGLNGSQTGIGSRAWVNPFTGSFPGSTANDHSGHSHDVTSHRILVDVNDLNTSLNPGATYFAEAEYIVPHEGTWCQSHPDQCNMYNNASYRPYTVTGINQPFSFSAAGATVREQPAIMAWSGATVNQIQPAPGTDGIWFMGYKVTNPSTGVWHYEYALYNQNLDRSIQSFSVPVGPGVNISNIGFHAPPQHPGFAHDGTQGDAGYSSTPWNVTQDASSITWSSETFAQNQNANAIRFGTLYNFRFDADQAPNPTNAMVGYFKTGSPTFVGVQAAGNVPLPSPTPTPTASPTPTFTPTPTPTPIPCAGLTIIQISGSIVPGTTDIGNHGDDQVTIVALPFPFTLYGQTFTSINLSSNGNAQFVTTDTTFTNVCLPWTGHDYTIFPYWDDLYLVNSGFGIFTSISGSVPNRIFNIEWRSQYFPGTGSANFELRLYEGQTRFDVIYGTVTGGNTSATAGVQRDDACFNQYFCNGSGGPPTGGWALVPTGTPTPTPTATATATNTPTPTPQPTVIDSPTPTSTPTSTATATVTPTATATATATVTVSPTPTPSGTPPCTPGWSAGRAFPSVQVRSVGVYFYGGLGPRFYAMGGRSADTAGSDFTHPFEYTPFTNTWVTKTATYPDNQVSNMACGVLTVSGTQLIYCVGGSAAGAATATGRVFFYNPATDTITTLTGADDWPGAQGTILPGGFSVFNNKLYILGGFNINVASTNQIWQFDPTAAVGSKWLQRVNTPVGVMYAPTATIGNAIYVGGASDYQGGSVIDTTNSFKFDPVANTTSSITAIPRATGETRGLTFNGKMLVMGGGRVAPNPSNEVDAYDPVTNTWSVNIPVPAFMTARRNFATDTGPNGVINSNGGIWVAGGYAPMSPTDSTEVFCGPGLTPTATPTATITGTPMATVTPPTPTATATATPPTPTPTATSTSTPRPSPTPRGTPPPRPRPTPPPRP